MAEYLAAVGAAITLAIVSFPFAVARKSPQRSIYICRILGLAFAVLALFLNGVLIGLNISERAPELASWLLSNIRLWIYALAAAGVVFAFVFTWVLRQLHDE